MRIELAFTDGGGRWIDSAPDGITIGTVSLHGWEVHPVNALPDVSTGRDCYLIKVNYELDLAPASVTVSWLEPGFAFRADSSEPVTVVDALPRSTHEPVGESMYTLTDWLHLVPYTAGASVQVHLPATMDVIDVFGVGGERVRWRHLARAGQGVAGQGVRSGSGVAWIVALVPKGCSEIEVEFSARYALHADDMVNLQPTQETKHFSLKMRESVADRLAIEPVVVDEGQVKGHGVGPRVFISYAHDDEDHVRLAVEFGELLVRLGVDLHMDKMVEGRRQEWSTWAIREILDANFITILASPKCRAAGDGRLPSNTNPGIQSELSIIRDKLHGDREHWMPKLLPVVLPGERLENIPTFLLPHSADHYIIDELTEEGLEDLLRAMGRSKSGDWPPARPANGDTT